MHFAVKIDATTGFHTGADPLTQRLVQPGTDGVIAIAVTGSVGIIDPDIARTTGGASRELLLESVFFKHAAAPTTGVAGDEIIAVDDLGVRTFQLVDFSAEPIPFYRDRRWLLPLGYKLLVNFAAAGAATLRLNFWVIDSPEQLVAAPPI